MEPLLPNISLTELDVFLRAGRVLSMREAARQTGMSPGALSKILKRLEVKFGAPLITRSTSGILLTSEGKELQRLATEIIRMSAEVTPAFKAHSTFPQKKVLSIGSISFLCSCVIARSADKLAQERGNYRFRIVEFTHNQLVAHGLTGAFEIALHIGPLEWTRLWGSREIGTVSWGLYAGRQHPLTKLKRVTEKEVLPYPFVVPTGWTDQGFSRGEDFCPIPWGRRQPGHEAVTAETALQVVQTSNNLTFVPRVLAQKSAAAGFVQEIKVEEFPAVEKTIYLSTRDDLISKPFLKNLIKGFQAEL